MLHLSTKNLAIFLSQGMSLVRWEESGLLDRELDPINQLAARFQKIYLFSYGADDSKPERGYQQRLAPNVEIIPNQKNTPAARYKYLAPFRHRALVRSCDFLKTEQMSGALCAILAKVINPRARLIIRAGYSLSFNLKKSGHYLGYLRALVLEFCAYHLCAAGLVTSRENQRNIIRKYLVPAQKIHLIANYINTDIFKPDPQTPAKAPAAVSRLLYVGRLDQEKNLVNLIKALKGLKGPDGRPLGLDLVGQGRLKPQLRQLARKNQVPVKFIGVIPNHQLPAVLRRYLIFIQVSLYEGMPKTLLEAMSTGLACIGTNVPGIKEVIIPGRNGLLTRTDPMSINKTIKQMLGDQELQQRLGEQARRDIVRRFSLKEQIKKELRIYAELTV